MFKYSNTNKRYYTVDYFYKQKFNSKVAKIGINASFTCPNIDGKKGYGGCIFCLNGGTIIGPNKNDSLLKQFYDGKKIMDRKWPNLKYIVYFQSNSNTYASLNKLKSIYEPFLNLDNVVGISISTRSDCFSKEIYDYLEDLNKRTFLTIELGLQSINEKTNKFINRLEDINEFENCIKELNKRGIFTVVHIINGFPFDTKKDMLNIIKYLNKLPIQGIKFHMLAVVKKTMLAKYYKEKPFHILTKEEYIDILKEQIRLLRSDIVIERISTDPDPKTIIEPKWLINKRDVMNSLDKLLAKQNIYQGEKKIR